MTEYTCKDCMFYVKADTENNPLLASAVMGNTGQCGRFPSWIWVRATEHWCGEFIMKGTPSGREA